MSISKILNKLSKDVANRYDDFIFEQFERHGFSREYVEQAIKENRVCVMDYNGEYVDYGIDGEYYFSIFKKFMDDKMIHHVIDLKGVKK